jgi:hypothetical protein
MGDRYTQLLSEVNRNSHVVETVQLAPFTYMKVKCRLGDDEYIGIGFAKKSPDDTWCENHGADVARAKAIGHILVQIVDADHEHWLDYATEQYHKAEDARRKLEVAEKKIADMMDAMREAVNDAKAEEDDGAPKPRSRVVVMNRPDEVVMFATINRKAADQIVRIASRFGSARVAENGHVWLYLNPCYDKREVIEWVIGKIDKGIAAVNVESPCEKKTPWRETGGGFTFSVTTSP